LTFCRALFLAAFLLSAYLCFLRAFLARFLISTSVGGFFFFSLADLSSTCFLRAFYNFFFKIFTLAFALAASFLAFLSEVFFANLAFCSAYFFAIRISLISLLIRFSSNAAFCCS